MYPKIFAFVLGIFFAAHADAVSSHWGLPGSSDGDIQNITITELASPKRTATLIKPDEIAAFAQQFAHFNITFSEHRATISEHHEEGFYKVSVLYRIVVQQRASTYTLLLVSQPVTEGRTVSQPDDPGKPGIQFQLWVPEADGSFTEYSAGGPYWLDAGTPPLERYLAHLFPPA